MKRVLTTIVLSGLFLGGAGPAMAELLTLRTYYPSPEGVYDLLQLMPRAPILTTACDIGVVYYNNSTTQLYMCLPDGVDGEWVPLGGSVWTRSADDIYPNVWADPSYSVGINTDFPDPNSGLDVRNGDVLLGPDDGNAYIDMTGAGGNMFRMFWVDDTPPGGANWLRFANDQGDNNLDQMMLIDGDNRTIGIGTGFSAVTSTLNVLGNNMHTKTAPPTGEMHTYGYQGLMRIQTLVDPLWDSIATLRISPGPSSTCTPPCVEPNFFYDMRAEHDAMTFATYTRTTGALRNTFFTMDSMSCNVGMGEVPSPSAQLTVRGIGDTNATSALSIVDLNKSALFTMNNAGAIGIQTAPWADLDAAIVAPNARFIVETEAAAVDPSAAVLLFPEATTTNTDFSVIADNDLLLFRSMDNADPTHTFLAGGEGIGINAQGNVSFGKLAGADANVALDVDGNIDLTGCMRSISAGAEHPNAGACVSDGTLKQHVRPVTDALEKLAQLHPVSYEFTDTRYGRGPQTGLIAQEVQGVFPDWVTTTTDGNLAINYGSQISMMLIQALQDLNQNMQDATRLLEENAQLKDLINKLERQLRHP